MQEVDLVLLRHGRSQADDEGVHEGRYDSPLSDVGRQQAHRRAHEWCERGVIFDRVVTSPLRRALETAEIVAGALDVDVEPDEDWLELDNGPLAGLPFHEADEHFLIPDFEHPFAAFAGVGESQWEATARAARGLTALVRRGPGKTLVVAHGGILNAAMRVVTGSATGPRGQGVMFVFGDLGFANLTYQAARHLWIVSKFQPH